MLGGFVLWGILGMTSTLVEDKGGKLLEEATDAAWGAALVKGEAFKGPKLRSLEPMAMAAEG